MFLGNKYPADLYIVYKILLISTRHNMGFLYMYHGNLTRRRLNDILRKIKTVWPQKDSVVPFIKAMSRSLGALDVFKGCSCLKGSLQ